MDIFKISSAALVTLFLCIVLKRYSPEYAVACGIFGCMIAFYFAADGIREIFVNLFNLAQECGIKPEYITLVLKITGIAFVGQLCASLCRDAGQSAVAASVELCTSVIIIALGMPIVLSLFSVISSVAGAAP